MLKVQAQTLVQLFIIMRDSRVHSPDAALVLEETNRHAWRYFSQNTQMIKIQKTQNGTK